jgi:hypothetical protein
MANETTKTKGSMAFSVTSLVTGIVGVLFGFFFWMSLPLAAVAITFGALSLKKGSPGKGMAIAGLVTGVIAALAGLFIVLLAIIGAAATTPTYYYY